MWESTRDLINVRNRWGLGSSLTLTFITRRFTRQSRLSSGQMGSDQSKPQAEETRRFIADLQFRVLVIGRANAGKTTILQRVCETTESPKIYRRGNVSKTFILF